MKAAQPERAEVDRPTRHHRSEQADGLATQGLTDIDPACSRWGGESLCTCSGVAGSSFPHPPERAAPATCQPRSNG